MGRLRQTGLNLTLPSRRHEIFVTTWERAAAPYLTRDPKPVVTSVLAGKGRLSGCDHNGPLRAGDGLEGGRMKEL